MGNSKMDFKEAFNFALERFKGNPKLSLSFGGANLILGLAFFLVVMLAVQVLALIIANVRPGLSFVVLPVELLLFSLANGLALAVLTPAFFSCIEKEGRGESSDFAEALKDQSRFKEWFITAFLSCLICSIGFMLCVLPGLAMAPVIPLSLYLVWKGDKGFDAFKRSFGLLYGNMKGGLFLLGAMAISAVGVILCLFGLVVSIPLGFAAALHLCEQMMKEESSQEAS
jgi:hypothetical protein